MYFYLHVQCIITVTQEIASNVKFSDFLYIISIYKAFLISL